MTEMTALEFAKQALTVGLEVSTPLLLASLMIGTSVGMVMAATQVQEFTLTFVPKLLAMAAVMLIAGPWMLRTLVTFALSVFQQLPSIAP